VVSKYDWGDFSYAGGNGKTGSFNFSYKNGGNTIFDVSQKIEISGFPAGYKVLDLPDAMLLQENEIKIPAKWSEPFFGFYTAKATVTFSEMDITTNKAKPGTTLTKEVQIFIPLKLDTLEGKLVVGGLIALILLLTALIGISISRLLFRKKCSPYTVSEGDSIVSIAEACEVDWKRLARVNKLRAPYNLKTGQKIVAPPPKNPKKK
jgi:hypothetical protein